MSSLLNLVLLLPHHWASATPGASSVHLSKWKMDSWAQPETWSLHANKRLFRRGKKKYGEFIIFICLCNIFGYIFGSQSFGEHCKKLINLNKRLTVTCFGSGFLSRRIIIWQLTTSYSETGDFEERRYLYRVAVTSDHFNSQFFTNQKLRIARDSLLREGNFPVMQSDVKIHQNEELLSQSKKKIQEHSILWMWDSVIFQWHLIKWAARDCFHFPHASRVR